MLVYTKSVCESDWWPKDASMRLEALKPVQRDRMREEWWTRGRVSGDVYIGIT